MSKEEDSTNTNAQAMRHLAEATKLLQRVAQTSPAGKSLRRRLIESTLQLRRMNDEVERERARKAKG